MRVKFDGAEEVALFDVLMPVRNGQEYLRSAIESVRRQTVQDWRLLILDHGSSDNTPRIVEELAHTDRRIEYHPLPQAASLADLLNLGLDRVQAPFIMRMDADDLCLPHRMAASNIGMKDRPNVAVLGGQAIWMDADGRLGGAILNPCDPDELARTVLFRNPFVHPAMVLRSSTIKEIGIRYGNSLRRDEFGLSMPSLAEDYLLFGELAQKGMAANIPDTVLHYRFHPGGVSRQKYQEQMRLSAVIARFLASEWVRAHGGPFFDPAPFGTYGETLMQVGESTDYADEYERMHAALHRTTGAWSGPDAARDLKWRRVFVDRRPLHILSRALRYGPQCKPVRHERRSVRNAVRQLLVGRQMVAVPAHVLPEG